jgi:hypothetical protein
MEDKAEQIEKLQQMLRKLTQAEKAQLIEMLVRKYGTQADIEALLGVGVQPESPSGDDRGTPIKE